MKKGLLIIFSGPSGVGKGTVRAELFKDKRLNLAYSISMTTRKPRTGEKDGVDYFFVSKERFLQAIENDELLEHAQFVDNYYGTPFAYVEQLRNKGLNVVLEIEIEGAKQVMKKCPDAVSFFLIPPSLDELERRIRGRKTEDDAVIKGRLNKARIELEEKDIYSHVIINDTVENAKEKVTEILLKYIEG